KITYPRREMGAELLKLQDKTLGETAIVHDQPEQTYYVAVLTKQSEPSREDFFQAAHGAAPDVAISELFEMFEKERRDQYRKGFMEQLRADAKLEIIRDRLERGSRPESDEG